MIAMLRGVLVEKHPNQAIVETHGVGYDVVIPVSTYTHLPDPGAVRDCIHAAVPFGGRDRESRRLQQFECSQFHNDARHRQLAYPGIRHVNVLRGGADLLRRVVTHHGAHQKHARLLEQAELGCEYSLRYPED